MPTGEGLDRLVDASAILSTEQQTHIAALHAENTWSLDPVAATVTLTAPDGGAIVCRAHFLGTSAPGPGTWLWGWQNINDFPQEFVALAERVRDAGEEQGVRELATAELPLTDELPRRLTVAAKTVTGIAAHYSGPIGGGSRAWLLIEHPDLELPPPTTQAVTDAIVAAIEMLDVHDHAEALASWARQRGVTATAEGGSVEGLRLALSDGELLVAFDDQGRIGRMETQSLVGLDAAAAAHRDPESQHANDIPTEAIELPPQEPPLAPEPDPDPQPAEGRTPPTYGEDVREVETEVEEAQDAEPERPMRRLLDFLRGPKP